MGAKIADYKSLIDNLKTEADQAGVLIWNAQRKN